MLAHGAQLWQQTSQQQSRPAACEHLCVQVLFSLVNTGPALSPPFTLSVINPNYTDVSLGVRFFLLLLRRLSDGSAPCLQEWLCRQRAQQATPLSSVEICHCARSVAASSMQACQQRPTPTWSGSAPPTRPQVPLQLPASGP